MSELEYAEKVGKYAEAIQQCISDNRIHDASYLIGKLFYMSADRYNKLKKEASDE